MSPLPDFSDLLPQWRAESQAGFDKTYEELFEELKTRLAAEPATTGAAPSVTLTRKATAMLARQAEDSIIPGCLQWLEARAVWQNPDLKAVAAADIKRALSVTLDPSFHHPSARVAPAPLGWLVVVVLGALAGGVGLHLAEWAFALPADDTSRRALACAAIGAGLVATLTARALERPEQRLAFEAAAGARGFFTRYRAIKAALAQSSAGGPALLPLIFFYLLRPRLVPPTTEDRLQSLQRQLQRELRHLTDLVLAFCLTHPDRQAAVDESGDSLQDAPPLGLYEAVGALDGALSRNQEARGELREAAEELLQRFEEDGFAWRQAAPDACYDSAMEEAYRPYGLLEAGQPVATRKAALFRHGKLLIRGILAARK